MRLSDTRIVRKAMPKARYHPQLVFSFQAVWFNLHRPPYDDPKVRKAIALAVNNDDVLASLGGRADAGVYAGFVPPFLAEYAWPAEKLKKFPTDIEQAKKLLTEAGFKRGLKPVFKTASVYASRVIQEAASRPSSFRRGAAHLQAQAAWGATGSCIPGQATSSGPGPPPA